MVTVKFLIPPSTEGKVPERLFGCAYSLFPQPNIFMLYPAAVLDKAGYKVDFIDCPTEGKADFELDSDIYVFYTVFLAEEIDKNCARKIREQQPNSIVVFMGPEPTARPEDFLFDEKTFVLRGETEKTILEFVKELETDNPKYYRILGLSWRKDNKIVNNPPRPLMTNKELDELPFPARHLIKNPDKYFNPKLKGRPSTVMLTSRNCFGRCIYCIPSSYTFAREIEHKKYFKKKPPVGLRSPENIIAEFKQLKQEGYKAVSIVDDNFINGEERTIQICKGIKDLRIEWGCLARADMIKDEKMVKAMAESGCTYVDVGVESLDQRVLDYVKKDMKLEDNFRAIKLLKNNGIQPKVNILLGACPLETEEMIKDTVEKIIKMDLDYVTFAIVLPHPQTEFYKICKENKWFVTETKDYRPASPLEKGTISFPGGLSSKDYERLLRWCYKHYYLRLGYILKKLKQIKSWRELKETLNVFWNLIMNR
jgi:radical SAM superfamily enzyme YgiQ (UPF0313 family)